MASNAVWVWAVMFSPMNGLEGYLDRGWEPFAVTQNVHGHFVYHLRRKVRK